ncbi:MAG: alpha-N-arabinofuranosidase [Streptosporangiales bacterium]|nr:alpha-N-arabinofuranosidase [Streptosporangiales bacterium]
MARVKIDLDRAIGTVDRRIFGGFIEHLGRCIYGGVFDEGSELSDERGFRRDVLEAARGLRMPVLRWPGGNFVSGYHWVDGIGPRDARPRRPELAWHTEEPNRFGTDEFVAYCRELGTEPYICLNMGTGTLDEALAWVEYCNGTGDTYWANRRRENSHLEPYRVRYWGLGNEMYGDWQVGQLSAGEYVAEARRWAKALRRLDPDIELASCGENGWSDWDRDVVDGLIRYVDFHSIHIYTGSRDYWANVLAPHQAERALRITQALIDRARYVQRVERPVYVAYDEWNVWFRKRDNTLEERYTLADALAVATYLNVFVRNAATVRIANLAQLVNVIAPIVTAPDGLFLQPIYHPLRLAAEHTQEVALDVSVECDTVDHTDLERDEWPHRVADLGPFPLLDVAATRDREGRRVVVSVVNRAPEAPVKATITLGGSAARGELVSRVVTADSTDATNSFERPGAVDVAETRTPVDGDRIDHEFPPHSYTQLQIEIG